jgi:hypothetical protein
VSSTVFDIVGFLSILPNVENKLVSITKIKQRWYVSSVQRLIGNGEKLLKLFANSGIIILERVRTCDTNFVYAIAQCCSIIMDMKDNNIESCKTIRDAIEIIENNEIFDNLRRVLLSTCITYYVCGKCRSSPDSLSSIHECIYIYERQSENCIAHATPIIWKDSLELHCSVCNEKSENVILPIHTQMHLQCPSIMIYCSSRTTLNAVINLHVELTDHIQNKQIYKPLSVLLIDEYNAISVFKLKDHFIYCSSPYQTPTPFSNDGINGLFDTSRKTIIFLEHVRIT